MLKGIQTPEDAVRGVECGADAIWISNHGGRQIDTAPATVIKSTKAFAWHET